jgi:hypothetical protein
MTDGFQHRLRTWIACYAAALTIALEQVASVPRPTATETPTPLVRVREEQCANNGWHPDELIRDRTGSLSVLVWESVGSSRPVQYESGLLKN